MKSRPPRPGEIASTVNPDFSAADANLIFIGQIRTPWTDVSDCPNNLVQAREIGKPAWVEIDPPWRQGLLGVDRFTHIILLHWLHESRRDLIVQSPAHAPKPTGVFSIRSPVRPNPISFAAVKIVSLDQKSGRIDIDAVDCLDGTPLLDIKPYFASTDSIPDAVNARLSRPEHKE